MEKKTVLFVCTFNSVRSQIAEGLLNNRCKDRYTAFSAGIAPAGLNPYTLAVMREVGIDITAQRSKKLAHFTGIRFDYVITMCDRVKGAAPKSIPQGENMIHRGFVSPSDIQENKTEILADFRVLRDEIDSWLTEIFPDCPESNQDKTTTNDKSGT